MAYMLGRALSIQRCTKSRLLSTTVSSDARSRPDAKNRRKTLTANLPDPPPATRTIVIRTGEGIRNMLEAFAILQNLEQKFGTFQEFRFIKDNEYTTRYQGYILAAFESIKSFELVPHNGTSLSMPRHPLFLQDGGIGLDDLQLLMLPMTRDPHASIFKEAGQTGRTKQDSGERIEVRVERAGKDIYFGNNVCNSHLSPPARRAFGFRFIEWGGFAPLETLGSSAYNEPVSETSKISIDRPEMRAALTKWNLITTNSQKYPRTSTAFSTRSTTDKQHTESSGTFRSEVTDGDQEIEHSQHRRSKPKTPRGSNHHPETSSLEWEPMKTAIPLTQSSMK